MPRKSNVALSMEEQRLQTIHKHQTQLRRRLEREINTKKATKRLPGELNLKKNMAIFLKIGIPGISYGEIGSRIGETKSTVKKWFNEDPHVREQYEIISSTLKDSALELMEFYALEAVETLVLLMRFGAEKIMLESATQILDRIGVAKLTKTESEIVNRRTYEWEDQSKLLEEVRQLPPEHQEQAISHLEELQKLLLGEAEAAALNDDESDLKPLVGREEETELEDSEDEDGVV